MTQRIDGRVDLRAFLAFPTVIPGTLTALGRGAQRPAIDDRGARLGLAARRQTQHRAQIVDQCLEASRRQPALRLLVYRKRGRQAADYAACATRSAVCADQFQGMSSSHRAAGQSAAIFPVTSAM